MAGRKNSSNISIRCDICHIRLNQNAWMDHVQGKRHSELLAKGYALQECVRRSLFVVGFPKQTTKLELLDYFSKFASVADIFMDRKDNKFAIVELNDVAGADRIFLQKHFFNGIWLNVKRRSPKNNQEKQTKKIDKKESNKIDIDMNIISEKLLTADNFEDQIHCLINTMVMSEEELNKKMEICKELETLMKEFFPNCQAVPYGSNVSGLGTKGCDLDIFVDLNLNRDIPIPEISESEGMQILSELRRDLKHFRYTPSDTFLFKVACLEPRLLIQLLCTIIKKYFLGSTNVFSIKSQRCPIVSFFLPKLNIDCDVSIKNSLGVHNSVLIGWYCKFDPRVVQLLFALRVWAKQVGVCDAKIGRFSSYAITMLGLFYLQNCKPPVIPTVDFLQSLEDIEVLCSGWKCQFCMDKSKIPQSVNHESVGQLLKGFFKFYFEHPLTDYIICLRTGTFCVKEDFIKLLGTDERLSGFKVKTFNVQDPFELNFNLATSVIEQAETNWASAILIAHQVCSCDIEIINAQNGQFWGLAKLLFSSPPDTSKFKKEQRNVNGYTFASSTMQLNSANQLKPISKDLVFLIPSANTNIVDTFNSSNIVHEAIGCSLEDLTEVSECGIDSRNFDPDIVMQNFSAQEEKISNSLVKDDEIKVKSSNVDQTENRPISDENVIEADSPTTKKPVLLPNIIENSIEEDSSTVHRTKYQPNIEIPNDVDGTLNEETKKQSINYNNLTKDVSDIVVKTDETLILEDVSTTVVKNDETLNLEINKTVNVQENSNGQFDVDDKSVVENKQVIFRNKPLLPLPIGLRPSAPIPLSSVKLPNNFRFHPYNIVNQPRSRLDVGLNHSHKFRPDYYGHDNRFNTVNNFRGNNWEMQHNHGNDGGMFNERFRMETGYCSTPPMKPRYFDRDFNSQIHSPIPVPNVIISNSPSFPNRVTNKSRVTPAKPKKSRITAISQNFTIITCGAECIERMNSTHFNGLKAQILPEFQPCNLWSYDIMREILSVALRMECEVLSGLDTENPDKTPLLLLLKAYQNTWVDRKSARATVQGNSSEPIITESKISDYLIKKYPSVSSEPLFICHCFLLNVKEENQFVLRVKLELITTMNKEFINFTTFLKSVAQKIFTQLSHSKKLANL